MHKGLVGSGRRNMLAIDVRVGEQLQWSVLGWAEVGNERVLVYERYKKWGGSPSQACCIIQIYSLLKYPLSLCFSLYRLTTFLETPQMSRLYTMLLTAVTRAYITIVRRGRRYPFSFQHLYFRLSQFAQRADKKHHRSTIREVITRTAFLQNSTSQSLTVFTGQYKTYYAQSG